VRALACNGAKGHENRREAGFVRSLVHGDPPRSSGSRRGCSFWIFWKNVRGSVSGRKQPGTRTEHL